MDMLEFLGTYETAGGKGIDPQDLPGRTQDGKTAAKPVAGGKVVKTGDRKNLKKKGESND